MLICCLYLVNDAVRRQLSLLRLCLFVDYANCLCPRIMTPTRLPAIDLSPYSYVQINHALDADLMDALKIPQD
jgi:hypothetical protein